LVAQTRGSLVPIPADAPWAVGPDDRRIANWVLRAESMTIGRANECDIVIRDPSVSRRHVALSWIGGRLLVTHLSSTNPTLVNGVPVQPDEPVELASADKLQVGAAHFEVLLWSAQSDDMTKPHAPPRSLVVVLAADVVGYTMLCKRDEAGTLARFQQCLRVFRQEAQRNRGRLLDTGEKGDCVYSLYHSVVLGLSAAVAIRDHIAILNGALQPGSRLEFRFGMHCGDVVFEGQGIRGDAINTAAHLQTEAQPGEIIVSSRVQQDVAAHGQFTPAQVEHSSR
jgi:class 3 adenylate cyclase